MAFAKNRSGSVAVLTGVALSVLAFSTAATVQYSTALTERKALQTSIDAAALHGAQTAARELAAGASHDDAIIAAERSARGFLGNEVRNAGLSLDAAPAVSITLEDSRFTASVSAIGKSQSPFAGLFPDRVVRYDARSKATTGAPQFVEVHVVIDVSASMGVGATAADHVIMDNTIGCAFACHVPAGSVRWRSTKDAARSAGATLRIDVIREATKAALSTYKDVGVPLSVAVHTFSNTLQTRLPPTRDLNKVLGTLDTVDMIGDDFELGTNFHEALHQLADAIPMSGSGTSAADPEVIVLLMTDGVATNVRYNFPSYVEFEADPSFVWFDPVFNGRGAWAMQGFDPAACDRIKNEKRAKVVTVHTEYITPAVGSDRDLRFSWIGRYLAPDIVQNLQNCASDPSLDFTGDSPEQIGEAIAKALNVVKKPGATRIER